MFLIVSPPLLIVSKTFNNVTGNVTETNKKI
jgi:hypothetical protein